MFERLDTGAFLLGGIDNDTLFHVGHASAWDGDGDDASAPLQAPGTRLYCPDFPYTKKDLDCCYCTRFTGSQPYSLDQCICLAERIVTGAVDANRLLTDCIPTSDDSQLRHRLRTQ